LDARLVAPMRFEAGEQGDPEKSLLWSFREHGWYPGQNQI